MNTGIEKADAVAAFAERMGAAAWTLATRSFVWMNDALDRAEPETITTFSALSVLWGLFFTSAIVARTAGPRRTLALSTAAIPTAPPPPARRAPPKGILGRDPDLHPPSARPVPSQGRTKPRSGLPARAASPERSRPVLPNTPKAETKAPSPRAGVIGIQPFKAETKGPANVTAACALTHQLRAVLGEIAPNLHQIELGEAFAPKVRSAKPDGKLALLLTGQVRLTFDRVRITAELRDARTLETKFRFRYQTLPQERDKALAEIALMILRQTIKHSHR